MNRRAFLAGGAGGLGLLAGCVTSSGCDPDEGQYVIRRDTQRATLGEEYAPIRYDHLSSDQQDLLQRVVKQGQVAMCEPTPAFRGFLEIVRYHRRQQENITIYLAYDTSYYGLYVQNYDAIYSSVDTSDAPT